MIIKKKATLKGLSTLIILSLILVLATSPVWAQSGKDISLSKPDLEEFPDITFYLDVNDRDGSSVLNLTSDQITIEENDIQQDIVEFQELSPGIQIVAAFNVSNPFAIQDINGISRLDYLKEALINWSSQSPGSAQDDISILSNDGLEFSHLSDKDQVISILEEYDPEIDQIESNFNVLAQAVNIASDPVDQNGMKKVILFFTSQPTTENFAAIDSLVSQAVDNQVKIYTILVSSPAFFNTAGAAKLQSLTAETGGIFLPFSGDEPAADFEQLLKPLRSTYLIKYNSQIITPGIHSLKVTVSSTLAPVVGDREFFLDVQPPNPIFVTPPRIITRQLPEDPAPGESEETYQPESYPLDIILEFPDQHPRALEELIFRVDGEIVDRKTSPPYDQFIWDLTSYESSSTHILSLEAVDILGLSRTSAQTPIAINVIIPPPKLTTILGNNAQALVGLSFILLVGLGLFIFISQGRIQPGINTLFQTLNSKWALFSKTRKQIRKIDPSSTTYSGEDSSLPNKPFRLLPINDISQVLFPQPIRVDDQNIKIGRDLPGPGIIIDHPSIFKEHAIISCDEMEKFQITDLDSTAGTWINYQQIPPGLPQFIKDGDIIHIGEAVFRFQVMTRQEIPLVTEEKRT